MSSLYNRGNLWWVSYYNKELGKPKSFSTKKKDRKEANAEKKKFEAEQELGLNKIKTVPATSKLVFSEALKIFLSDKPQIAYKTELQEI